MGIGVSLDYVDCEKVFVIVNELESKKEVAMKSITFKGTSGAGIAFRNLEPLSYNIIVQRHHEDGRIETMAEAILRIGEKQAIGCKMFLVALLD